MNTTPNTSLSQELLDQASDWYARLKSDNLSDLDRIAFSQWLSKDKAHQTAYAKIEALWEDLAIVSKLEFDDVAAQTGTQRCANLSPPAEPAQITPRSKTMPSWPLLVAPAVMLMVIGLWMMVFNQHYKTTTGEQRTLFLEDGSIVYLNTNSSLSVDLSKNQRRLKLKYGQAFFDVAHDANRPFIVEVGEVSVKAVGTAFDIFYQCRDAKDTVVTVVDGKVRIRKNEQQESDTLNDRFLQASEQTRIHNLVISEPSPVNPALYTSWKDQRLIYDGAPLIDVVNDINRYIKDELKISDPSLKSVPVSAVFKIQDQTTIIKALEKAFHLKAIRVSDSVILLDKLKT